MGAGSTASPCGVGQLLIGLVRTFTIGRIGELKGEACQPQTLAGNDRSPSSPNHIDECLRKPEHGAMNVTTAPMDRPHIAPCDHLALRVKRGGHHLK